MRIADLKQFDSTLEIVHNQSWPEEILAISSLEQLTSQSIVFIKNARFLNKFLPLLDKALELKIGVIIDAKFYSLINAESKEALTQLPFILTTANVAVSLTHLSKPFYEEKFGYLNFQVDGRQMGTTTIDASARIAQGVFIGEHVSIGANVIIHPGVSILPHVSIGDNSVIYPNVSIYPFTQIGKNCRIHAGVVIGSDGFGYTFDQGQHKKIWHMGGVEIQDNVEIGSNTSVDQGTFSPTIIGAGTRIDNLVQIAHNCRIGRGCILCGQSGLAGSVTLEDYVVLGGRAAVGPDSFIGMGSQIAGGAKVNESANWPAGSKLGGHPAKDLREWMKGVAYLRKVSLKE